MHRDLDLLRARCERPRAPDRREHQTRKSLQVGRLVWGAVAIDKLGRREKVATYHRILTTENKWLAARYGLEAPVMDLVTGRRNRIPVAQTIRRTLKLVGPHARELGSERELAGIETILSRGNGADRQLRIFNANRDIVEVVREIAELTEAAAGAAA